MNINKIFNNNSISSPVIIHAECRIKYYYDSSNLIYYDCINGIICKDKYNVTIHNYESESLGFNPMIKNEQNYCRFIHLSTLLNFPWGLHIKFRDNDGVIFEAGDIIRLLGERTENMMKKWKKGNVEFKKRQDKVVSKLNIKSESSSKPKVMGKTKAGKQSIMEI